MYAFVYRWPASACWVRPALRRAARIRLPIAAASGRSSTTTLRRRVVVPAIRRIVQRRHVFLDDFEDGPDVRPETPRDEYQRGERRDDMSPLDGRDERARERPPDCR